MLAENVFDQEIQCLCNFFCRSSDEDLLSAYYDAISTRINDEGFQWACKEAKLGFTRFPYPRELLDLWREEQARRRAAQAPQEIHAPTQTIEWHTERLKCKVSVSRSLRLQDLIHTAITEADQFGIGLDEIAATPDDLLKYFAEIEEAAKTAQAPDRAGNLVSLNAIIGGGDGLIQPNARGGTLPDHDRSRVFLPP